MKVFVLLSAIAVVAVLGNPAANREWRWKSRMPTVSSNPHAIPLPAFVHKHTKKPYTPGTKAVNGCGPTKMSPRIVGGSEAEPHSFPWQVALFIDDVFNCGGSIINEEWILTAAHCLSNVQGVKVVAGAHNVLENEPTQVSRESTDFIIHEDYSNSQNINDIALIRLPSPLSFNENIAPICLPSHSDGKLLAGTSVTASGWGWTSDGETFISPTLKESTNKVIRDSKCADYYSNINGTVVCTETTGGHGTCHGDSGGPLNYQYGGVTYLRGVTSFGPTAGCESGRPDGFTRVISYLRWIGTNTGIPIDP